MKRKILYINTYIPYPLNSGGNQAFFTITDYVRKHHDLSLLLYVHNSQEKRNIEELKKLWSDVTFYIYDPQKKQATESPYAHMSWIDRQLCQIFDYFHYSMKRKVERRKHKYNNRISQNSLLQTDIVRNNSTLFMNSDDLTSAFCEYVKNISAKGFDIVQVEFFDYLPLVYMFPKNVKKVFVHHELRFIRNENEIGLFKHPLSTDRIILEEEKAKEIAALNAFDAVVTLTEIDKNILQYYLPYDKLFSSPAITQSVSYERQEFKPCNELIFVGSGNHFPNADGLIWFCTEVIPLLQQQAVELPIIYVTGQWRDDLKTDLTRLCPTLKFTGFIDNLQQFLNGKISVVPVRIGSGMRMKILDSIFAAAPIITTSKGCEGLPMVDGENCLIADTPTNFAQAFTLILSDISLQQRLAINAQNTKTNMLNDMELFHRRLCIYDTLFQSLNHTPHHVSKS